MPLILPGNVGSATAATGFNVANSCRFDGSSASMKITPGSNMNLLLQTWSGWIKRGGLGVLQSIFASDNTAGSHAELGFDTNDKLNFRNKSGNADKGTKITTRVFKDPSAWYHIVWAWDSANGTAANRLKIYVNGVQETAFDTSTNPDADEASQLGEADVATLIGTFVGEDSRFFNGYLAEVVLIDGAALAPTSFGEFDSDSGIWKPIDVSGLTFGTNGYYLNFADSSALGTDVSGNGNDYATANLAATDQGLDTCTNNFATMNTLVKSAATLSEGNLKQATAGKSSVATIGVTSGKWYFEQKFIGSGVNEATLGFALEGSGIFTNDVGGNTVRGTGYVTLYVYDGKIYNEGTATSSFATFAVNDIIGWNLDADAGDIFLYRNGSILNSGNAVVSGKTGKTWFPFGNFDTGDVTGVEHNFGGARTFSISSAVTDGKGFGAFEFAPKSGHLAICTKNLAENG